jgi:predicted alpha-1,2-mannosidase
VSLRRWQRIVGPVLLSCLLSLDHATASTPLADLVDPLIGTDSEYDFSHGNVYPAVSLPFGMTAWTAQTGQRGSGWIYRYDESSTVGIRATHQASVWRGDYGYFTIMPITGDLVLDVEDRRSRFSRDDEVVRPYYYRTYLERYGVDLEVTPTLRGAALRITPAVAGSLWVVIDTDGGGGMGVADGRRVVAGVATRNSGGVPDGFGCHFVARFSSPIGTYGSFTEEDVPAALTFRGAYFRLYATPTAPLTVQIATSFIDVEQALYTLDREIGDRPFETLRDEAASTWEEHLQRIRIEGATRSQERTFYTALYRSLLFPRTWFEVGPGDVVRHYSPYDGAVHPGELYADHGMWDVFRTAYPLLTLLWPDRVASILRGWTNAFRQGGWFPNWPSPGYREGMVGSHLEAVVADAWTKGVRAFDAQVAFQAMRKNGTVAGTSAHGREGLRHYLDFGYVPSDSLAYATSRTLEYAYGDFAIATMATALGHREDARRFHERSGSWRDVFDPQVRLVRGRRADGSWEENDVYTWGGPFIEGTGWQHTWAVLHDLPGLVEAKGGPRALGRDLDRFFEAPPIFRIGDYDWVRHEMMEMTSSSMGQYAHNNQQSHHVLYLYNLSDRPWKGQAGLRRVVDELYDDTPKGYLGDEDTGSLGSWYIFSTLGLYPLCPGKPEYALGSPRFDRATLTLPAGRSLSIVARDNGTERPYVRSVTFEGRPVNRPFVDHADIAAGGELLFHMGSEPAPGAYRTPSTTDSP